jgi:Cu(I)/Ag(I) efflux system membrane fusion protein
MKRPSLKLLFVAVLLLAGGFLVGRACAPPPEPMHDEHAADAAPAAQAIWTCSMHPQVRLPEFGACPICGMDLIEASADDEEGLGPRALRMTESAMALADIATAPVERRSVAREVDMVGKVALDETRVSYITSWVSGRLDRLFVDYTGVLVRAGDHLVEIYSPTLYSAQQELLQAIETAARLKNSGLDVLRSSSDRTVVSSKEKLRLYGLTDEQIQRVVDSGEAEEHVTIYAPTGGVVVHKHAREGMYVDEGTRVYTIADLSKLWVLLDAYESDLAWLRYGQDVEFSVAAYPGETFHGRVAFIDPLLNDRTRTVKVRLIVDNADLRLKPNMFVSATAAAVLTEHGKIVDAGLEGKWMCPMHPEVIADGPEDCSECGMTLVAAEELGFAAAPEGESSLVIPATAPLITGKRAVVYVRLTEHEEPTFEGREIELGPRAGDWYIVYDGLAEGEEVVVRGNFKLDSELQIRARPSMMNPEEGAEPPPEMLVVPEVFRRQLGAVVDAYVALHARLADDGDDSELARALADRLAEVDMALLSGDAHEAWMAALPGLRGAAEALAAAPDMKERRSRLSPLTNRLVPVLDTLGYARDAGPVGLFHCPMALSGVGADWIQAGDEVLNPYYGSMMLGCGDRTRGIESGE